MTSYYQVVICVPKNNKERQRRYRFHTKLMHKKNLRKEQDRNIKRFARAQKKLNGDNNNIESNKPVTSNL